MPVIGGERRGQVQVYMWLPSTQVPPLRHGALAHSLPTEYTHNNNPYSNSSTCTTKALFTRADLSARVNSALIVQVDKSDRQNFCRPTSRPRQIGVKFCSFFYEPFWMSVDFSMSADENVCRSDLTANTKMCRPTLLVGVRFIENYSI